MDDESKFEEDLKRWGDLEDVSITGKRQYLATRKGREVEIKLIKRKGWQIVASQAGISYPGNKEPWLEGLASCFQWQKLD